MQFKKPQDYVDALKELEGAPLMGMEVRDGLLFFTSLSGCVALPLRNKAKEWGYKVVRYGLNKLDVFVSYVKYNDQFKQVRLFDENGDVVAVIVISQPTDPLPVFVSHMREALVGSRVQSVSVSDGGLCLHLDDDYDAVSNGASRVRIDANRIPFTVGCVDVNHGDGFDMLRICAADLDDRKPVVMFRLDQDTLNRKELSFNVI